MSKPVNPPGWNDPPMLNYDISNPPPKSRIMNKRVAFPMNSTTASQPITMPISATAPPLGLLTRHESQPKGEHLPFSVPPSQPISGGHISYEAKLPPSTLGSNLSSISNDSTLSDDVTLPANLAPSNTVLEKSFNDNSTVGDK